jgi:hypothetical protein
MTTGLWFAPFSFLSGVYGNFRKYSVFCFAFRFSCLLCVALTAIPLRGQVNVLTGHDDIARTGQNLSETILTPSNVNPTQFGKLFGQSVNGWMLAQPLYVQQVAIAGLGTHNVVYAATILDDVYAFDADTNGGANANPLWHVSLLTNSTPAGTLTIDSGVWGTPVIDLLSKTMYLVSSEYQGTTAIFRKVRRPYSDTGIHPRHRFREQRRDIEFRSGLREAESGSAFPEWDRLCGLWIE